MKIFISHSHQNDNAAKALVDFLLSSLSLEDSDIRCTSVPGHQLRFGKSIAELLKADISEAPVLIAMISKESVGSDWVLFELGAAWGLNRDLYPILGPSLQIKDLPGPLSAVPCVEIESPDAPSRMSDLVQQLAEDLQVATRNGGKAQANLDNFLKQYKSGPKSTASTGSSLTKAENAEDTILLVIWRLHESEYDEHG
ncbi:MAG: TIR domain-containing protein [Gammaproteobacteria bacterium]